jgi:ATP-binding cassette, subfamily B, bacterial
MMNPTKSPSTPLALLASYVCVHRRVFLIALGCACVNQIFMMVDPLIFSRVLDDYVIQSHKRTTQDFLLGVGGWLCVMLAVALVAWAVKGVQTAMAFRLARQVSNHMYADSIGHSLKLPYAEFERRRSGDMVDRLQRMRREVDTFVTQAVSTLFTSFIGLVVVLIYAARIHWSILMFLLVAAPLVVSLSILLSQKVQKIQQEIVEESAALAASTTETLTNIELVKSLGLTGSEVLRFKASSNHILELELVKIRYARMFTFFHGAGVNLLRAGLILLLMYLLAAHRVTVGQFFSMFLYLYFILGPLQEFGTVISQYRDLESLLRGFLSLLAQPSEAAASHPALFSLLEKIQFDTVGFSYPTSQRPAVTGICFHADRGETIAFVGPSGAGKSTLVKLLSGLYEPSEGQVRFNDVPGSQTDWNALRNRIGLVTQETHLFAGTIRENLRFVSPDVTEEECLLAIRRAAAEPMLQRAPLGLDTVVGEGGMRLSGGEKQRLSIARALLRRPELLIFDEATSALDSLTEEEIAATIRNIAAAHNTITIVITHRLATVVNADRIYTLDGGRIIEVGTHDQLIAKNGLYHDMWRRQSGRAMPNPLRYQAEAGQ